MYSSKYSFGALVRRAMMSSFVVVHEVGVITKIKPNSWLPKHFFTLTGNYLSEWYVVNMFKQNTIGMSRMLRNINKQCHSGLYLALKSHMIAPNVSLIARFMGPTRGPPGSCRPELDPTMASWTLLSGYARSTWSNAYDSNRSVPNHNKI